jgi:AcrR family transcriptional regulator
MQESKKTLSNQARTRATQTALLDAARELFATKGYADTGTPEIVARAGVTRGALYHHFVDKHGLFRAVVEREAQAVVEQIENESMQSDSALDAMLTGADAYFEAMSLPGRTRLLLLEGPAILGVTDVAEIDRRSGQRTLRDGLAQALSGDEVESVPVDALAAILSAAFDQAAFAVAGGAAVEDYKAALRILLLGIPGMKSEVD